jgi:putative Mn2+ efflux pump MntP
MKMKNPIAAACLFMLLGNSIIAQDVSKENSDETAKHRRRHMVKLNLTGLALRNYGFQ